MEKKGELTTQQLVTIIILIVSFAVILFFIFRLDLGGTNNKQICHNSVVLKSKTAGFGGQLDCRTNYLCISGGGDCEDISPTQTVKVNPNSKKEIMEAIAEEMADCWWMFGEGEIDYLGFRDEKQQGCAICSVMAFDEKIREKTDEKISYEDLFNYMEKNKRGEETYFKYLYGVSSIEKLKNKINSEECNLWHSFTSRVGVWSYFLIKCNRVADSDLYKISPEDGKMKFLSWDKKYSIITGQFQPNKGGDLIITYHKLFNNGEKEIRVHSLYPIIYDTDEISDTKCTNYLTKAS